MTRQRRLDRPATTVLISVPGSPEHHIGADILFLHLSRALAGRTLTGGEHVVIVDGAGRARIEPLTEREAEHIEYG